MRAVEATDGKDGVRMTDLEGAREIQIRMMKDHLPAGFSEDLMVAVIAQVASAAVAFLVVVSG